jgi:hypothetical protein
MGEVERPKPGDVLANGGCVVRYVHLKDADETYLSNGVGVILFVHEDGRPRQYMAGMFIYETGGNRNAWLFVTPYFGRNYSEAMDELDELIRSAERVHLV